jgi:signal transduction histidine kinase
MADRELISRALANAIDNALKYGGDAITVRTHAAEGEALLEVADNGPGIARKTARAWSSASCGWTTRGRGRAAALACRWSTPWPACIAAAWNWAKPMVAAWR